MQDIRVQDAHILKQLGKFKEAEELLNEVRYDEYEQFYDNLGADFKTKEILINLHFKDIMHSEEWHKFSGGRNPNWGMFQFVNILPTTGRQEINKLNIQDRVNEYQQYINDMVNADGVSWNRTKAGREALEVFIANGNMGAKMLNAHIVNSIVNDQITFKDITSADKVTDNLRLEWLQKNVNWTIDPGIGSNENRKVWDAMGATTFWYFLNTYLFLDEKKLTIMGAGGGPSGRGQTSSGAFD